VGQATGDGNFTGGSDQVRYQADLQGHSGPFTVTAKLLYQSLSYGFVQDLAQDSTSQIDRFLGFFNNADRMPVLIAVVEKAVE